MKVIELLNKIANGEEAPERIQVFSDIFVLDENNKSYKHEKTRTNLLSIYNGNILNYEAVIIEDKKIKKLENVRCYYDYATYDRFKDKIDKTLYLIRALNLLETKTDVINDKINEIIDKINNMEVK